MQKLRVADIKDVREYEREREEFRARIIEMKKRRRIHLGELLTITFEHTETMRFQVQEMARAERMVSDEQIAHEVETYNQLIPDDGELSGTLSRSTTRPSSTSGSPSSSASSGRSGSASTTRPTSSRVPLDEERLTREEVTSTVHYLKFPFTPEQADALRRGPARIVVGHPEYSVEAELSDEQRAELARSSADPR